MLMFPRLFGSLGLLVPIFPIIHDPAHRRRRRRRHLHQIQAPFFRFSQRVNGTHDPQLIALLPNDANLFGVYLLIDPDSVIELGYQ